MRLSPVPVSLHHRDLVLLVGPRHIYAGGHAHPVVGALIGICGVEEVVDTLLVH